MRSQFTLLVTSVLILTFLCSLQALTLPRSERLLRARTTVANEQSINELASNSHRLSVLRERLGVELVKRPMAALTALLSAAVMLANPSIVQASFTHQTTLSVAISASADVESERWNSARFFEEEDSGRLLKVVFSPDGKTASGIDADGKRFVANLQSENSNSYAYILAPIALLGVGAFAFSKSSEGQAMKAVAGLEGSTAASTTMTKASVSSFGDDTGEDRSYEFESLREGSSEPTNVTPEYLLSCMLSGSYYMPPETLLRSQSSAGRRIRYKSYRKINPTWISMKDEGGADGGSQFAEIAYANIPRLTFDANGEVTRGIFRLYKFQLSPQVFGPLNQALADNAMKEAISSLGIAVSNAGGYHSTKDYFKKAVNDPSVQRIAAISQAAVTLAERTDLQASQAATASQNTGFTERTFRPSSGEEESWVNINRNGHWNRLHTHAGASWSGVYYIKSLEDSLLRDYSGRLLLKPTSHPLEATYTLSDTERARLSIGSKEDLELASSLDEDVCDYLEITAEEGLMILMPSWLHHGVLPLSVKSAYRKKDEGARISLAFNFNSM